MPTNAGPTVLYVADQPFNELIDRSLITSAKRHGFGYAGAVTQSTALAATRRWAIWCGRGATARRVNQPAHESLFNRRLDTPPPARHSAICCRPPADAGDTILLPRGLTANMRAGCGNSSAGSVIW